MRQPKKIDDGGNDDEPQREAVTEDGCRVVGDEDCKEVDDGDDDEVLAL